MSSTFLEVGMRFNPREVFTAAEAPAAASEEQRTLFAGAHSHAKTYGSSTTPKVDKPPLSQKITLTTGVPFDLDLTAAPALVLPGGSTRTFDYTGAKVKAFLLRTLAANTGTVTIGGGANPYLLLGAVSFVMGIDDQLIRAFRETESNLAAVAGGAKILRFAGTTGDFIYVDLILGT